MYLSFLPVYLQVPDAGTVEEGRVDLSHLGEISHVPHIQTVVIIYTAERVADRIVANGNGIWVTGIHLGGDQVTGEKKIGGHF